MYLPKDKYAYIQNIVISNSPTLESTQSQSVVKWTNNCCCIDTSEYYIVTKIITLFWPSLIYPSITKIILSPRSQTPKYE